MKSYCVCKTDKRRRTGPREGCIIASPIRIEELEEGEMSVRTIDISGMISFLTRGSFRYFQLDISRQKSGLVRFPSTTNGALA